MVAEKIGQEDKRKQEFIKGCSKYVKPYVKLTHPLRQKRVQEISMGTLFAVIDRSKLKKEGLEFIQTSRELVVDVCTFLDHMKSHLELNFFKINFDRLKDEMPPDFEGDDDVVEVEKEVVEESARSLSSIIHSEASRRRYDHIRNIIWEKFGSKGMKAVKTTYQIRKEHAAIVGGIIEPSWRI